MREHRARLRAAGLVKVECWVGPAERERLGRYVEKVLGGYCPVGRQGLHREEGTGTAGVVLELPTGDRARGPRRPGRPDPSPE